MQPGGVEASVGDSACSIDVGICGEIELGRDCDVKCGKELWWFCTNVICIDVEFDPGVHGMDLGRCGLGALGGGQDALFPTTVYRSSYLTYILSQMFLPYEELRSQVLLGYLLTVDDGERPNACQDQVFGDFISKSFSSNQENVGGLYSGRQANYQLDGQGG